MTDDISTANSRPLAAALRLVAGVFFWLIWMNLTLYFVVSAIGLSLSLIEFIPANDVTKLLGVVVLAIPVAIAFGWLGGNTTARMRLDWPTWWIPPLIVAGILALIAGPATASQGPIEQLRAVVVSAQMMLPLFIGQWLEVRRRRRAQEAAAILSKDFESETAGESRQSI